MKKIIISLILVVALFGGSVAHAQVAPDYATLQQQYDTLIARLIELLTQRIVELRAQIAAMEAQTVTQVASPAQVIQSPQIVGVQNTTTSTEVAPTSTPTVSAPVEEVYDPQIVMWRDGEYVRWRIDGRKESFNCQINGTDIYQEGSSLTSASTTLNCIGVKTATRLIKTL